MSSSLRPWVTAALLLAAGGARGGGASPWSGAPFAAGPAAVAAAAASLRTQPGVGRDVLLDELRVRIAADGAVSSVRHVVYRVSDPDAARVEIAWAPAAQERPRVRGRVIGPDASERALDPRTLSEGPAPFTLGQRILSGPLPGAVPGAVVELEVDLRGRPAAVPAAGGLRVPLAGRDPVRWARVEVSAPAALSLRWRVRASGARPHERLAGGVRRLELELGDVAPAPEPEPGSPRELAPGPELLVAWGGSWREVAEQAGAAFARADQGSDVRSVAGVAAAEAASRDRIAARLTAWIHANVRCTGVPPAEGGLAPARPETTLRRREGGDVDLALLLVELLRARGLPARPALVRAAWDEIPSDLPGLLGFDHVLVRVEGTPPIWIDPCDAGVPAGRLPAALQDRLALPLGPGIHGLARTPASTADQNRVVVTRELLPARLGRGAVVEARELVGAPADAERTLRRALSPEERDDLEQRHAREVLHGQDVVYASVEGDLPGQPLRARMEVRGSEAVVTGDENASLPVPADQVFELLPEALTGGDHAASPPRRRTDLLLPFPFRAELSYRVVPPDGFRLGALPTSTDERFGPVRLHSRFSVEAGGVGVARYQLECEGRRLTAAQADALAQRIHALRRDPGPSMVLERISAALFRDGRVAEALAELRAVAARHPDDVVAAGQLALGLLRMGFPRPAEAEVRRVLQLQPASGWGHRVLGLILEHDELGRYRGPGFRRAAAIAAYDRARQLDPGSAAARAQLADLLALDASGLPSSGQRTAALHEYEALARDLGDHGRDGARLELLFDLGRFDRVVALARELPPGGARDAAWLAAAAARGDGTDAVLQQAERFGADRAVALREASRLLVRAGRHAIAAELARAAADAAPDAPGAREHADALDRLEGWERSRAPGDEAEWTIRRLLHVAAVSADPVEELASLVAPWLEPRPAEGVRRSLAAPFRSLRRSAAEQGLDPFTLAQLLVSGAVVERDGDAARGERVRLRFGQGARAPLLTVFLAPAGVGERIVATDATWSVLAGEADRAAAAGDVEAAERWLSFARDALGEPAGEADPAAVLAALTPAGWQPAPAELRRAAMALLAFDDAEARTIPALASLRASAPPPQRRALGFALAAADRAAARWTELDQLASELEHERGSRAAAGLRALALARLGRIDDLRALAAGAAAHAGEDPEATASVAGAQLSAGDLPGSLATYRSLIAAGKAGPLVYNDAAWLELFQDPPAPDALGWARRATSSPGASHAALNTLAAVAGSLGRAAEAREALVRSLDAAGRSPPEPADWLAQGLVAEACGLPSVAREAYERVTPEADDPSAPYVLARRRLAALDGPRPPVPAPSLAPPAVPAPPAGPHAPPAKPKDPTPARRAGREKAA